MTLGAPGLRRLLGSAAVAAAVALGGCQTDGTLVSGKHLKPLSPEMTALLDKKQMPKESPLLVRIFKQESELEVWKQNNSGRYALLKTYPICRWSGELGPKVKEGDRQAPEGFYTITPAQMNPNSQFYLSFNLGYPNAFDQAHGRTGAHLMVHGDCSSRGCYAMTDDQISEIYALGRESFFGGQRAFQVQAYPFRMTAANLARHRNNPNMAFWKMLKEGNDHFEVTGLEPKVDVCEKRYVFNAEPPPNATAIARSLSAGPFGSAQAQTSPAASLKFNPTGRCPAYRIDPEVAAALSAKRQRDEAQLAELVRRGAPTAPIRTGVDGGMHPTFLAKLKPTEIRDADGSVRMVAADGKPLGSYVNPPREPDPAPALAAASAPVRVARPPEVTASVPSSPTLAHQPTLAASESRPAKLSGSPPTRSSGGNMFTRLFSFGGDTASAQPASGATPRGGGNDARQGPSGEDRKPLAQAAAARALDAQRPVAKVAHSVPPRPTAAVGAQAAQHAPPGQAAPETAKPAAAGSGLLNGATPVVPAGTFESRWGAFR